MTTIEIKHLIQEAAMQSKNVITFLVGDKIMFWLFQTMIVLLTIYATFRSSYVTRERKKQGLTIKITRGSESIGYLNTFVAFFMTILSAIVFTISDTAQGYKITIFLFDLSLILYLSFWNNWFRNKLVGVFEAIKNKKEE